MAALLLTLLRDPRTTEANSPVLSFFAQRWLMIGYLLFLVVARVAFNQPLSETFPDVVANALFLLLFLGGLFTLVGRYLKKFGSPLVWGQARHHQQVVQTLGDPHMDSVRGVLQRYVERGDGEDDYALLTRTVAERLEMDSRGLEQLLSRKPSPLQPETRALPAGPLVGAGLLLALALALGPAAAVAAAADEPVPTFVIFLMLVTGLLLPLAHRSIKPAADPELAGVWFLSATLCALAILVIFATSDAGLPALIFLVVPGIYLLVGILALGRRRPEHDRPTFQKVRALQTHAKTGRVLIVLGASLAGAILLYALLTGAILTKTPLPRIPAPAIFDVLAVAACLALAGTLLGPLARDQRDRIQHIHDQERSMRSGFHLTIVQHLEGGKA